MKKLLGVFMFLFVVTLFGQNPSLANCTFSTTEPFTCDATIVGENWCNTGCTGCSSTNWILYGCNGTSWEEVEKSVHDINTTFNGTVTHAAAVTNSSTVTNNGAVTQAANWTVSGTRTLDFGANKLTNLAAATANGDAVRFEQAILTTGAQSKSGILTFTTLPESSVTPTTADQLTNKAYVDAGSVKIFTATADNSFGGTTEGTLFSSGQGSLTILANTLMAGSVIKIKMFGKVSTTAVNPALRIRVTLGSNNIIDVVTIGTHIDNPITDRQFVMELNLICRSTGLSGTVIGEGYWMYNSSGNNPGAWETAPMLTTSTVTVDTTSNQTLDVIGSWSNAGQNLTIYNAYVELLK